MKTCFKCGESKERSFFYKHSAMSDGYLGKCKECTKSDVAKHRLDNLERIQEYDRNRPNHKERMEKNKARSKTASGKISRAKGNRRYIEKYPEKYKAGIITSNAIRSGLLLQRDCEVCGEGKVEGHHDDYSKPLDVRWLCGNHHREHHKQMREHRRES